MKQITITGFAHCRPANEWESSNSNYRDGFNYGFCHVKLEHDGFIHVGTATLTIEAPDDFDPRVGAVMALEERRKKIQAEFQARIVEIDRQISQYTAIEFEVPA